MQPLALRNARGLAVHAVRVRVRQRLRRLLLIEDEGGGATVRVCSSLNNLALVLLERGRGGHLTPLRSDV